jgi:hypothetical protein
MVAGQLEEDLMWRDDGILCPFGLRLRTSAPGRCHNTSPMNTNGILLIQENPVNPV